MTTRVRVGDVEVRVDRDLSAKQLRSLMRTCAGIHLGLIEAAPSDDRPVIGFAAPVLERLPEEPTYIPADDE